MSLGSVTNHLEWRWIMRNNMLIGRDNYYYVRKSGMERDYEVAFGRALDQATKDIANAIWPMADQLMIRIKQREGMTTMKQKEETK